MDMATSHLTSTMEKVLVTSPSLPQRKLTRRRPTTRIGIEKGGQKASDFGSCFLRSGDALSVALPRKQEPNVTVDALVAFQGAELPLRAALLELTRALVVTASKTADLTAGRT